MYVSMHEGFGLSVLVSNTMEYEVAARVLRLAMDASGKLNEAAQLARNSCSASEFVTWQAATGRAMGAIYIELIDRIFREHPSLIPPEFNNE